MREVIRDLHNTEAYLDDVLVYSETFDEHLQCLRKLFERLQEHGLHAKPSKCFLMFDRLEYLGHLVGNGTYEPLEDKVADILKLPLPRTLTELQSFLGSMGYYNKFISNFSELALPLTEMTKTKGRGKRAPLQWTQSAVEAFKLLKEKLASKPVLQLPDNGLSFALQTDASDVGAGAVLLQPHRCDPSKLAPVAFASKKFTKTELNYATVEKEALAIYWAINKFANYLYGRPFTLITDHKPLLFFQSAERLNPRIKRWSLYLSMFTFYVKHVKGSENAIPDALSRVPYSEHDADLA